MKKYIMIGLIIMGLVGTIIFLKAEVNKYKERYSISMSNTKALIAEIDNTKSTKNVLQLKINQLDLFQDSIMNVLNKSKEDLNIKDKNIKYLQYLLTETSRVDTITFIDTIFSKDLRIDTIIQDPWYKLTLKLRYPNQIITEPKFRNEFSIITHGRKETINPPKKFFLFRWFQKKHTILTVDVKDESPYSENKKQRFIEIIK